MPYQYLPKIGASYVDGNLRTTVASSQPRILAIAPGKSGLSYELFTVDNVNAAEVEFGADTDLLKCIHEARAQGANNLAIMRVGGRQGTLVLTDSAGGTLTIRPEYRDDLILSRYALIMETTSSSTNRILVWDLEDETWVYDSEEILVLNEGIIDVNDTGIDLFTIGNKNDPNASKAIADLLVSDFTAAGSATMSTVVPTQGTDGTSVSLVEKYAALATGYHLLDFRDADYIIPKGVFINDQNVADEDTCNFFKGPPVAGSDCDSLGYLWQYIYQGKLFTYFVDSPTYFTNLSTAAASTVTVNTDLVLTAQKTGVGGNKISIAINAAGAAGPTVAITEPDCESLLITVTDDGTATTSAAVTAINLALGLYTTSTGVLASTLVQASGGSTTLLTTTAATPLAGGTGGHVLTHTDLTGDAVPAAVTARFAAGVDAELRECNFAHQLASFCHLASTNWKAIQGFISVKKPDGFSRADIAAWVGTPPTLSDFGLQKGIDAPADNGTGLFAIKLMAGKSVTSAGYRASLLTTGNSTDSYAYGGIILTKGSSLPTAREDFPYGIDDSDEAEDLNGAAIDIGKHIHVTVDWPIHRNAYNGGTPYRGSIEALEAGVLAIMPENEEPISIDRILRRISSVPRIHSVQLDQLAQFRFNVLRLEDNLGYTFASVKTAAHPLDSDYTRSSTMRVANRLADGIRNIAKPFLGKPFDGLRLASLQTEIDGYLRAERGAGMHQGARAPLSYTREGKILGQLDIELKFVPPFTIEVITQNISLAADESELQ